MQWGDMDALGHVNNTCYFRWFESARISFFLRVGVVADEATSMGPILATTTCNFLRPLAYPGDLVVGARVPKVGNTSFVMEYALALAEAPDEPCATGSGVIVLVDYKTGEKQRVPDSIRDAIAALG